MMTGNETRPGREQKLLEEREGSLKKFLRGRSSPLTIRLRMLIVWSNWIRMWRLAALLEGSKKLPLPKMQERSLCCNSKTLEQRCKWHDGSIALGSYFTLERCGAGTCQSVVVAVQMFTIMPLPRCLAEYTNVLVNYQRKAELEEPLLTFYRQRWSSQRPVWDIQKATGLSIRQ